MSIFCQHSAALVDRVHSFWTQMLPFLLWRCCLQKSRRSAQVRSGTLNTHLCSILSCGLRSVQTRSRLFYPLSRISNWRTRKLPPSTQLSWTAARTKLLPWYRTTGYKCKQLNFEGGFCHRTGKPPGINRCRYPFQWFVQEWHRQLLLLRQC